MPRKGAHPGRGARSNADLALDCSVRRHPATEFEVGLADGEIGIVV
jgi:hypothetical protein